MKIRMIFISLITVLCLVLTVGCSESVSDIEAKNKDESMVASAEETKDEALKAITSQKEESTTEKIKETTTQKQMEKSTEKKTEATTESVAELDKDTNDQKKSGTSFSSPAPDISATYNQQTEEESTTEQITSEPVTTEQTTECSTEAPEQPPEETVEETTEALPQTTVSYSPQNVVSLATSKCISGGMIKVTDYLNELLASGSITQEEYDEYYPYDGLGYYSVFVETDLNAASTTSGRKLGSEQGIADYIADMLLLEREPYFLIEYGGESGGFYEFRCYR